MKDWIRMNYCIATKIFIHIKFNYYTAENCTTIFACTGCKCRFDNFKRCIIIFSVKYIIKLRRRELRNKKKKKKKSVIRILTVLPVQIIETFAYLWHYFIFYFIFKTLFNCTPDDTGCTKHKNNNMYSSFSYKIENKNP